MAITIAQQVAGTVVNGNTSKTLTPGGAYASGALLVLLVRTATSGASVSTVTGGGVTTWVQARADNNITIWYNEIWYGFNSGGGSANVVVTYAATIGSNGGAVSLVELAGAATSGDPVDTANGANSNNGTAISVSVTPTNATEVIIFAGGSFQADASSATPGPSGWTDLTGGTIRFPAAYKIVSSASGAYSATWGTGYNRYGVSVVAFKAAGGGGGGGQVPPISRGVFFK